MLLQSERVSGICREPCGPSRRGCSGNSRRFGTEGVMRTCGGGSGDDTGAADQVLDDE